MHFKTLLSVLLLSLSSLSVTAGGGHDHGHGHSHTLANKQTVENNATKVVVALTKKNKLEKTWTTVKANSVEKKIFNGKPEWVVMFTNKEVSDPDKQKLYIFLTLGGDYIAANHTGN